MINCNIKEINTMKTKITTLFLFAIILYFVNSTSFAEQDPLTLGNHFLKLSNYDAAITEYKRFIFFHPDDIKVAEIYNQIGLAYRSQGLWQEAIASMKNAVLNAFNDDQKSEFQLDLAVTLIASKNYDLARLELIKVMLRNASVTTYRRSLFLQAVTYIYQYRWEEVDEILKEYTTDESLDKVIEKATNLRYKSTKVAKVLSAIIPGSGQMYAGDWGGGLNALGLNGTLGYVTVDAILKSYYIDAALWTYFIFRRYYMGNLYRSETAVETYNQEQSQRTAKNILQRLQKIANGK